MCRLWKTLFHYQDEFEDCMHNYAYVTLITTNSYMPGVLVLWKSLMSTNTKYPLYCVVTSEVSETNRNLLKSLGIQLIDRPEIPMPDQIRSYNEQNGPELKNWYKAFSKFHIFGLDQFDKIVYLDCDTFVKNNIDELFDKPHMSGTVDCDGLNPNTSDYLVAGDNYFRYFNSGVLVIEPSKELFEDLMTFVNNIVPDRIFADQNILAVYYKDWLDKPELRLSTYYNVLTPLIDSYLKLNDFDASKINVFHFVARKPWEYRLQELDAMSVNMNILYKSYMQFFFDTMATVFDSRVV